MIVSQCRQGIHIVVDAIFSQPVPVAASSAAEVLRLHRSSTRRQETYLQPVAPEEERARGERGGREGGQARIRRTSRRSAADVSEVPELRHGLAAALSSSPRTYLRPLPARGSVIALTPLRGPTM